LQYVARSLAAKTILIDILCSRSLAPDQTLRSDWSAAKLTPDAYLAIFAGLLARQANLPGQELAAAESALQPAAVMLQMLATQPPVDLPGVLLRLHPLHRLKLEYALNVATSPAP
jgi:hypothetical protein